MAGDRLGDAIIFKPEMHYNHSNFINAPASSVWPWVVQLGKDRAGWYLPRSWERVLPKVMHASRTINPAWQRLKIGDRIPDYGLSTDDVFDVVEVQENHALVYQSERYGTRFTWAILLHETEQSSSTTTEVQLRFRGRIHSTGWKRWLLVTFGSFMDWATTAPMLMGLKERAEEGESRKDF